MSNSIDRNLELLRAAKTCLEPAPHHSAWVAVLKVDLDRLRAAVAAIEEQPS